MTEQMPKYYIGQPAFIIRDTGYKRALISALYERDELVARLVDPLGGHLYGDYLASDLILNENPLASEGSF